MIGDDLLDLVGGVALANTNTTENKINNYNYTSRALALEEGNRL